MLAFLKAVYARQQFRPGFLGMFVNPFYFARRGLFESVLALASQVNGKILDVGCGHKPYQDLFSSKEYVGLEIDTEENRQAKRADIFYDGKVFPFANGEFDSAVANQVFEHVFNPDEFLSEINRVLRVHGTLLLTVPFAWDEHEQPYDYARYTSFGLKHILEKHGFQILSLTKSVADIRAIFQLLNCYIYKSTVTKKAVLNLLLTVLLMAPVTLIASVLGRLLPKNEDYFLDTVILAKKVSN